MKLLAKILLALFLVACHDDKVNAAVAPNPTAADCLTERDERQAECFHLYKIEVERSQCLDRVRAGLDCSTEAGVAAWFAGKQKDGGK